MTSKAPSTKRMKKVFYLLVLIALIGLLITSFLMGRAAYQLEHGRDSNLFPIVAIIASTMVVIPAAIAAIVGSKLKQKK